MISSFATPSSSSSPSPASSVVVRVEKATSELLMGPDWTLNIDICDIINSNHWLAKDVVKSLKKRLQHKSPKVQLLSLTLLETMVKNCGDNVHFQIAERNILQDMVKIVKKKTDMHVRDKILVLLDSWQQAFGGPGGKYTQYYWAYDELRRYGVQFPQRSYDAAPIFTPPRQRQPGYGMPSNSSTRLDEAMAAETEELSLSVINSMGDVLHLLHDMLQAVNPGDQMGVKDEVIVDLVERCRANQKKLMQMLATARDEKLLAQGLELNDGLQTVLEKHEAIASGVVVPDSVSAVHHVAGTVDDDKPPKPEVIDEEEEDEDDDFAQLARRHSKVQPQMKGEGFTTELTHGELSDSTAMVPAAIKTTRGDEDMIHELFGGLTLTDQTPPLSPPPPPPTAANQQPFNSYIAPWARVSPPQSEHNPPPPPPHQLNNSPHTYPPPPWAATNPSPYSHSRTPAIFQPPPVNAKKTFVPSYKLFEDLNVFGSDNQKLKTTYNSSTSMSGK